MNGIGQEVEVEFHGLLEGIEVYVALDVNGDLGFQVVGSVAEGWCLPGELQSGIEVTCITIVKYFDGVVDLFFFLVCGDHPDLVVDKAMRGGGICNFGISVCFHYTLF